MKLGVLAAFVAFDLVAALTTFLAITDTVQAAGIAAVASIANTGLLVHGQRRAGKERRELAGELRRLRRSQAAKRRQTRGSEGDAFVIEVPEDLDFEE